GGIVGASAARDDTGPAGAPRLRAGGWCEWARAHRRNGVTPYLDPCCPRSHCLQHRLQCRLQRRERASGSRRATDGRIAPWPDAGPVIGTDERATCCRPGDTERYRAALGVSVGTADDLWSDDSHTTIS